jgi:hypothetical protein
MICLLILGVGCSVRWCVFLIPPEELSSSLLFNYVRARALVLSGSLLVLFLVIVEVFLFQSGRFVVVVPMETLLVFLIWC